MTRASSVALCAIALGLALTVAAFDDAEPRSLTEGLLIGGVLFGTLGYSAASTRTLHGELDLRKLSPVPSRRPKVAHELRPAVTDQSRTRPVTASRLGQR